MNRKADSSARRRMPRRMLGVAVFAGVALSLTAAPAAMADTTNSSNWAGYAAHRSGVEFKKVSGSWTQPAAACTLGSRTYSSVWVGIGGFAVNSNALEQIGSEVDCNARGKVVSSVWYEVVPAPSRTIRMKVSPGDQLTANVVVVGHAVKLTLSDLTRGKTFTRTIAARTVDVSSAEWIVEAPSQCSGSFCRLLPLADFGTATFGRARAQTTVGHLGPISDHRWGTTRITLAGSGQRFINNSATASQSLASASPLTADGSSFTVTYTAPSTTTPVPVATGQPPSSTALTRAR